MVLVLLAMAGFTAFGQPNTNVDLDKDKPKQYENRKLGSEKTGDKKLKAPRRFMQNLTTHYNYYFNANTRLNEIIERAKTAQKDDSSFRFCNHGIQQCAVCSYCVQRVIIEWE